MRKNALCCQRGCKDTIFFLIDNPFPVFFYKSRVGWDDEITNLKVIIYKHKRKQSFLAVFVVTLHFGRLQKVNSIYPLSLENRYNICRKSAT